MGAKISSFCLMLVKGGNGFIVGVQHQRKVEPTGYQSCNSRTPCAESVNQNKKSKNIGGADNNSRVPKVYAKSSGSNEFVKIITDSVHNAASGHNFCQ